MEQNGQKLTDFQNKILQTIQDNQKVFKSYPKKERDLYVAKAVEEVVSKVITKAWSDGKTNGMLSGSYASFLIENGLVR